jgi:hypothetical protein
MTISAYHVNSIIKAYTKQSKARSCLDAQQTSSPDRYADPVTISGSDSLRADVNRKISYTLLDVLLKDKKNVL